MRTHFDVVGGIAYASIDAGDAAAITLCDALGLVAEHATVIALAAPCIARLPREDATLVTDNCADDIERAFDLPAGRLAMARGEVVHLRDRSLAVVGVAAFEAQRVTLLRVARLALVPALLADRGDLDVVVDGDAALGAALCAVGGVVRRRLVSYSGPIDLARLAALRFA